MKYFFWEMARTWQRARMLPGGGGGQRQPPQRPRPPARRRLDMDDASDEDRISHPPPKKSAAEKAKERREKIDSDIEAERYKRYTQLKNKAKKTGKAAAKKELEKAKRPKPVFKKGEHT